MVEYKTGYFAESLCGHDKGCLYMIVDTDGDKVGLCDGVRRSGSNPKYKKKKHIQMIRSDDTAAEYKKQAGQTDRDRWIREKIREFGNFSGYPGIRE